MLRWCEWEEFLQQAADAAADQNRAKADADDFVQGDAEIVLPGRELQYQARCAVGAVYVFDGKVTEGSSWTRRRLSIASSVCTVVVGSFTAGIAL